MSDPSRHEPTMEEILASIRRIISEDEPRPPQRVTESATSDAASGDGVLELTEDMLAEPDPGAAAPAEDQRVQIETPATAEKTGPDDIAEAVEARGAEAVDDGPGAAAVARLEALVSKQAESAASNSFQALAEAVSEVRDVPLCGPHAHTLESLVKELLRPMLKDWLDANLPRMVERLVEKEISRLSSRAEQN